MKTTLLALAAALFTVSSLQAQTAPAAKVDIDGVKMNVVETPQFQAGNVPEPNWRPKNWVMVDMQFDIKLPAAAGGRSGSLESMTVNYYLAMNATTQDGKRQVMKGTFDYSDIPAGEKCHALAFISPATLRRILQKDNFTNADISGWGVEILVGGQRVAGDGAPVKGPWWEKADGFAFNENTLLPKKDTPFSILWGDYDVGVRSK